MITEIIQIHYSGPFNFKRALYYQ